MTFNTNIANQPPGLELGRQETMPRILIAEDDDDLRHMLALYLKKDGYRITCVTKASDLLADLEAVFKGSEPPALIISDHRMPGITGLTALQQVREWNWTMPLVLITGFGDEVLANRAKRLGVTLMKKPFDMDDLRTLVGFLAPKHRSTDKAACAVCGHHNNLWSWDGSSEVPLCKKCRALLRAFNSD